MAVIKRPLQTLLREDLSINLVNGIQKKRFYKTLFIGACQLMCFLFKNQNILDTSFQLYYSNNILELLKDIPN